MIQLGSQPVDPQAQVTLGHPPNVSFAIPSQLETHWPSQQEHCSAIARHLFTHIKHLCFGLKAEVATWCQPHIRVDIVYPATSTISLVQTAGTKSCRLCAAERMILGQNISNTRRRTKILNLKSEMRGNCTCKARFLRFLRSN